jgi:hypothetical protein
MQVRRPVKTLARHIWFSLASFILATTAVHGQTIAGTVKDASGAVLPGVTVEASSPALIEKTRTVVTDGAGQYRIVSLSPGVYTVTFSLTGFNMFIREAIELTTDFTANVDAALRIGSLEESITVSGASPMVDLQSVTKQTVLTREVLDVLPTAHSIQAAGVLVPGVTTSSASSGGGRDVGGNTMLQQPGLNFRGTGQTIQRWDGFWLSNVQGTGTGGATSFYVNDSGAQELVYSTGADAIDMANPGLYVTMIPKDGGNTFRGTLFADFTHEPWSWSNLSDDLRARGITNVPKVIHISDFNPGLGGPVVRDKLWFYAAYRYQSLNSTIVDLYHDKNPAAHIYEEDLTQPARDNGTIPNTAVRLTWQASARDKVQFWFTNQNKKRHNFSLLTGHTPDARAIQTTPYAQATTLKWTRTQTSKLLFEAGMAAGHTLYIEHYKPHVGVCNLDECPASVYAITDIANGKSYSAYPPGYSEHGGDMQNGRISTTYVTGSHTATAGFMLGHGVSPNPVRNSGDLTMNFDNGVPQSVVLRIPRDSSNSYFPDLGIYVQDRFTFKRATLSGALRYDYYVGRVEDGTLPASRWNPSQFFPGFKVQTWKDLSPRLGIAYDLFGDGKTAIKANISRYVNAEGVSTAQANNPQDTIGLTDTRTWRDLNGDFTIYNPDGSVQNDELGSTSNQNFGKVIPTTTTTDPATLNGWNARGSTVEWQIVAQHQLTPTVAINGGYYLRYLGNQRATDNTRITNADFDGPFCINAPSHADLPGGGSYPVCGLYDIKAASRPLVQNNVTFARNFGDVTDQFQGFDFGVTGRFSTRTFVQGGVNAQKRVYDTCAMPAQVGSTTLQVDSPESRFCRQVSPYRPDLKFQASHTLPFDIVVSGAFQFSPGPEVTATWNAPNSIISAALGRNLSAGATATKAVSLIEPGTLYTDSLTQLDLRVAKRLTIGRYRLRGDINLYNVFNTDFASAVNTTFSTTAANQFLRPTGVLQGRLFKIGGQIEF